MTLKTYQNNTLGVVRDYFERAQEVGPAAAFAEIVARPEVATRFPAAPVYRPNRDAPDVPQVAVKVPTGGGKTILAAHAIRLIAEAQGVAHPFVLWMTPSETIRRQTAEALKNPVHPYRRELDAAFGGNVRVFDIEEKFQIRPNDVADNVCIVVTTAQAFRHQERTRDKFKVYRSHEDLEEHFADVPLVPGLEPHEDDPAKPKYSFANLVVLHTPIMIVDEAHKMVSDLSKETVAGLLPSAIFELTATPTADSNLVYTVRAGELYDEEMIKLPIELTEYTGDWRTAVLAALAKRDELEKLAPFQPLVLFQATDRNGATPIAELKRFLVETAHVDENSIAVVTGEQKELDGVDVTRGDCPIRLVITVEALKEGWDCPTAYILCSVANVHSNTDTVQLLGRVMRQPGAKRLAADALNRAYAFVMSESFNSAANDLAAGLQQKGFDGDEALRSILHRPGRPPNLPLFDDPEAIRLPAGSERIVAALPRGVEIEPSEDGGATVRIPVNLAPAVERAVVTALVQAGASEKAQEFAVKAARLKSAADDRAPSRTTTLRVPCLAARVQGELVFDVDEAYAEVGGDVGAILRRDCPELTEDEFRIDAEPGRSTVLFLNRNKIVYRQAEQTHQLFLKGFSGVLTEASVINALASICEARYVAAAAKRGWITGVVHALTVKRGYTADQLYCYRFQIKRLLERKLAGTYETARRTAYQQVFRLGGGHPLQLDLPRGFIFDTNLYRNAFLTFQTGGNYVFAKHFLGPNRIPAFDGKGTDGEEYACAVAIDRHPNVKFWLRNADSQPGSFRLPVSGGWFYPDFIGQLNDGRIFVIEYKGAHLATNADTAEKTAVGELWASLSDNLLYRTVCGSNGRQGIAPLVGEFLQGRHS